MQELSAVRDLNFSLRACASLAFWTAKPDDDDEEGALVGAGELLGVVDMGSAADEGGGAGEAFLPLPELEGTPGDDTRSTSCVPSAMGPSV